MPPTIQMDDALRNQLLAALPTSEFQKISGSLEKVDLKMGQVLWEAETKSRHIYFPTTSLILLLYESETGVSIEVGVTGKQAWSGWLRSWVTHLWRLGQWSTRPVRLIECLRPT